jgi:general stress protein 26
MNKDIKEEIWSYFQRMQVVFLATSDQGQARVRPVTMLHFDKKLWVGTSTRAQKTRQVKQNNKAEFCLYLEEGKEKQGYIRGECLIDIIEDKDIRKKLADQMPYFKNFWKGYDDPEYTLMKFNVKQIEYLKPGALGIKKIVF